MTCRSGWLLGLFVAGLSVAGCKDAAPAGGKGSRTPMAFAVEVAPVRSRDVEYSVRAVGSIEAFETIQITARVSGVVERVTFTEGQEVKKGEPLVEIDPSRYALAVEGAAAALERASAAQADARASLERRESVQKGNPGLIPAEELESYRTRARTAAAEARAAEVALAEAKLNLRDAHVRAPAPGVLQTRTVQTGQFVQPGTVLATLLQRDPLVLRFRVPEAEAARLKTGQRARFRVRETGEALEAEVRHVAGAADDASRMVTVTAHVKGDAEAMSALRPGAFAEVTVPVGSSGGSPVIPQTAIRPSERGFIGFVVEGDKAKERVLQLGLRTEAGQVEVLSGVAAGEQLVVRGAEALKDGVTVRVTPSAVEQVPVRGERGTR